MIPRSMLYDPAVPGDAKLVYLILSSHVGGNETAWPSHKRIADFAGISTSSVKRQLQWLRRHGYISWKQRVTADKAQLTNEYVLLLGSAPVPVKTGSSPGPTPGSPGTPPSSPGTGGQSTVSEGVAQGELRRRVIERESVNVVRLPPNVDEIFDRFWDIYPRREGKGAAKAAFVKVLRRGVTVETVLAGASRLRNDPNLPERQYVCHPTTWLNQGRWEDDPLPPRNEERSPAVNGRAGAVQHSPFLGVDSYQ